MFDPLIDPDLARFDVRRCTTRRKDGSQLDYIVTAENGPAVICVNALGQDLRAFSRLMARLARDYQVIAWSPCGRVPGHPQGSTVWDQVADLESIVVDVACSSLSIVAWCSGAKVAMEYARRCSSVDAMVMVNGAFRTIAGTEQDETAYEKTMPRLCATIVRNPSLTGNIMSSMEAILAGARTPTPSHGTRAGTEDAALNTSIGAPFRSPQSTLHYAQQVVDYVSHDIGPTLALLQMPVLVLAGAGDQVSSPTVARVVAARLPRGQYVQLVTATHYCLYDAVDETATTVAGFVSQVQSSARQAQGAF